MHHSLHVDSHVGILEALDALTAAVTVRKERERIACDLLENRVVVVAGEWHRLQDTSSRVVTARRRIES